VEDTIIVAPEDLDNVTVNLMEALKARYQGKVSDNKPYTNIA